jgi:hypothetical protein
MANVVPDHIQFRTAGERFLTDILKEHLDDLWTIYYEPVINGRQPDLILFHEYHGIIILEVKDYHRNIITEINPDFWKIFIDGRIVSVKSPIKQVIEYRNELITILSKHKELVEENGIFQGKLKFPVATACVFINLTLDDIEDLGIDKIIPKDRLLCKEDLQTGETLYRKMNKIAENLFVINGLSEREINIIKNCIYPIMKQNIHSVEANQFIKNNVIKSISSNIKFVSFTHYVDELYYVIDKTNHLIRMGAAKAIAITYPINRFLRVGTLEQFICDSLKKRGIFEKSERFWVHVSDIKSINDNINWDYLFVVDINSIQSSLHYQQFEYIIDKYSKTGETSIILTANKKSALTEKLKNRLAER